MVLSCGYMLEVALELPFFVRVCFCLKHVFFSGLCIKLEFFQITKNGFLCNSIAFGKSTSQRIYPKQHTHKIG